MCESGFSKVILDEQVKRVSHEDVISMHSMFCIKCQC